MHLLFSVILMNALTSYIELYLISVNKFLHSKNSTNKPKNNSTAFVNAQ